ncbi:MAG: hypothetical protein V4682_01500 [Patescibacteria group bacterium]
MPTLGELNESRKILDLREPRDTAAHARTPWRTLDNYGRRLPLARAQLKALGFAEPPSWEEILLRVGCVGYLCEPDMDRALIQALEGPDDRFRMAMEPIGGHIYLCTGMSSVPYMMPVNPPHHRLMLETEIVYPLRTN